MARWTDRTSSAPGPSSARDRSGAHRTGRRPEGTLVCTSVAEGTLSRIWPESGRREVIADTGGGANGAALAADGGFLVTQNGGIDFSIFEIFGELPPPRYVQSGLQRVAPDGQVSYLTPPLQMPNDLCVAPDGTVFFTDPLWPTPEPATGRILALDPDGSMRVVAEGFWAPNGIILDTDDETLIVVENGRNGEHHGFVRLRPDGTGSCSPRAAWATVARSTSRGGSTWPAVATW